MMHEGIVWSEGKLPYRIATPEKALLDAMYLSTRKGRRFAAMPELDVSLIDKKKFTALLESQVRLAPVKSAIAERWRGTW